MIKLNNKSGFTIVELLIATAVFATVLLAVSITVIEISRLYYKGKIITDTQTVTRALTDEISRQIQLESSNIVVSSTTDFTKVNKTQVIPKKGSVCIGTNRYTYVTGLQQSNGVTNVDDGNSDSIAHAIWRDKVVDPNECIASTVDLTSNALVSDNNSYDLLANNMRLSKFEVSPTAKYPELWNVKIGVIYGDEDLINFDISDLTNSNCKIEAAGSQWCSAVNYDTRVLRRLN